MAWVSIFDGGTSDRFEVQVLRNTQIVDPSDFPWLNIELSVNAAGQISMSAPQDGYYEVQVVPVPYDPVPEPVRLVDVLVEDATSGSTARLYHNDGDQEEESPEGEVTFSPDTNWSHLGVEARVNT